MDIRAFQDGRDFVIVFKNCHPDQKQMLINLLQPTMAEDAGLEPIHEQVMINYGKYHNVPADEILQHEGDKGFANLVFIAGKQTDMEERAALQEILMEYISQRFAGIADPYEYVEAMPIEDVRQLINCFSGYLPAETIAKAAEQAGYSQFSDFIGNAGEVILKSFAASMIEKLKSF